VNDDQSSIKAEWLSPFCDQEQPPGIQRTIKGSWAHPRSVKKAEEEDRFHHGTHDDVTRHEVFGCALQYVPAI